MLSTTHNRQHQTGTGSNRSPEWLKLTQECIRLDVQIYNCVQVHLLDWLPLNWFRHLSWLLWRNISPRDHGRISSPSHMGNLDLLPLSLCLPPIKKSTANVKQMFVIFAFHGQIDYCRVYICLGGPHVFRFVHVSSDTKSNEHCAPNFSEYENVCTVWILVQNLSS